MRWILGIFAVVGVIVIGLAIAAGLGLVSMPGLDTLKTLNAAAAHPATVPADTDEASDSAASLAALKHPGYQDDVIYLSAAEAKVSGRATIENRGPDGGGMGRGGGWGGPPRRGGVVDPTHRLPRDLIRGWRGPEDGAEWSFTCKKAGNYVITFDCTAGYGSDGTTAGGKFIITAGDQTVTATVNTEVTEGRRGAAFHLIDVGTLALPAKEITLRIQPAEQDSALLALRSIRIYPSGN